MEIPDEKHLKNAPPGAQQLQQLLWPYPGILRASSGCPPHQEPGGRATEVGCKPVLTEGAGEMLRGREHAPGATFDQSFH